MRAIIATGTEKEIAGLVIALQDQQPGELNLDPEYLAGAIHDTLREVQGKS